MKDWSDKYVNESWEPSWSLLKKGGTNTERKNPVKPCGVALKLKYV